MDEEWALVAKKVGAKQKKENGPNLSGKDMRLAGGEKRDGDSTKSKKVLERRGLIKLVHNLEIVPASNRVANQSGNVEGNVKRGGPNKPGATTLFDFCLVAGKKVDKIDNGNTKSLRATGEPPFFKASVPGSSSNGKNNENNLIGSFNAQASPKANSFATKDRNAPLQVPAPAREVAITPAMSKIFAKAVVRKKKKRLSTIKKKILMERLSRYRKEILNGEELKTQGGCKTPREDEEGANVVQLENFASAEEVLDEEEWAEIKSNLYELMAPFGTVLDVSFNVPTRNSTNEENEEVANVASFVYITFETCDAAKLASLSINGLTFGGKTVEASTLQSIHFSSTQAQLSSHSTHGDDKENSDNLARISSKSVLLPSSFCLHLHNLVFLQDIADSDEVQEVLFDIESLCSQFGIIKTVWIEERDPSIPLSNHRTYKNTDMNALAQLDARLQKPWGIIEFQNLDDAIKALHNLHCKEIGGRKIEAFLLDYHSYLHNAYQTSSLINIGGDKSHYFGVKLTNLVHSTQMIDANLQKIIDDTNSLFSDAFCSHENGFDDILFSTGQLYFIAETASPGYEDDNGEDCKDDRRDAYYIFSTSTHDDEVVISKCSRAVEYLDGLTLAGVDISATLIAVSCPSLNELQLGNASSEFFQGCKVVCEKRTSGVVVALVDFFDKEEIEEADDEEMLEFKKNIISVCHHQVQLPDAHGDDFQIEVNEAIPPRTRRVAIVPAVKDGGGLSHMDMQETATHAPLTACVEFAEIASAEQAMLSLDSCIIGGYRIKAFLSFYGEKENEKVEEDENDETKVGTEMRIQTHKKTKTVTAGKTFLSEYAELSDSIPSSSSTVSMLQSTVLDHINQVDSEDCKTSSGLKHSIYSEAKMAPKLIKGFSGSPDHRNVAIATPDIDLVVKEMLTTLATFQKRAKEKDKVKGIQTKMRFVMGIKQCTNGVKVGKAILVLMAPDMEQSEVLEGGLEFLLTEAAEREIPVIYCLSRRKLGKALLSSMRQTVVAIYSADGVYDLYKKVVACVQAHQMSLSAGCVENTALKESK